MYEHHVRLSRDRWIGLTRYIVCSLPVRHRTDTTGGQKGGIEPDLISQPSPGKISSFNEQHSP